MGCIPKGAGGRGVGYSTGGGVTNGHFTPSLLFVS